MILVPSKQIIFAQRLKVLEKIMLQPALLETTSTLNLRQIDDELHSLVAPENAKKDSPSTDRFFLLDEIFNNGLVFEEFIEELVALIGLR